MTQDEALAILKTGANVFLTGEPGSGKSHTINQYVAYLKERGIEPSITASTGIAATHIHGMTIHAWSGIGIATHLSDEELDRIATKEHVSKRIRSARVLIIDEISMLSATTLDMVDAVCREVRQSSDSFGGLQTILVGDFFQLPPVMRAGPRQYQDAFYSDEPQSIFSFTSSAWARMKPIVCYLSEQHRQDDAKFLEVLAAIRANNITPAHRAHITARTVATTDMSEGIPQLYSHNADVDRINAVELGKIKGNAKRYLMTSYGRDTLVENLKRGCLSPEMLELKVGASVMFTKNSTQGGFVNGTLGTVSGFEEGTNYPVVETSSGKLIVAAPLEWTIEDNGRALATVSQVPLRLAWAMTVHKSQGMSMDAAVMDLTGAFEFGQGYVALSRVRSLAGLYLIGINARALEVHPEILEKDIQFREDSDNARELFAKMPKAELAALQSNFIRAFGGKEPVVSKDVSKKKVVVETGHKEKLTKMRVEYPNAYMPWSDDDDEVLRTGFEAGTTQKQLSVEFGRQPSAIRARLKKLGLVE
jgi:ATP-dependent DNA helicase PIF1